MTLIIHLSDTHFGTEHPDIMYAAEKAIIALEPDIITITGDITQRATASQFRAAKFFLDQLPAVLKFTIPGNHEIPLYNIPLRLLDPYRHYTSIFAQREGVWWHNDIGIIGFDSTSRWRHTRGRLKESDLLARVKQARSQLNPESLLVACAHQPLAVGLPQDQENVLVEAEHIAKILSAHGVDLILSGHVHWPLIETTQRAFPKLDRSFVLSGAGTAISTRTRSGAPNSFNVIKIFKHPRATVEIKLMTYNIAKSLFILEKTKIFALTPSGWTLQQPAALALPINPQNLSLENNLS